MWRAAKKSRPSQGSSSEKPPLSFARLQAFEASFASLRKERYSSRLTARSMSPLRRSNLTLRRSGSRELVHVLREEIQQAYALGRIHELELRLAQVAYRLRSGRRGSPAGRR